MGPTSIILVRHGHVEAIDEPCFRGQTHHGLTAVGMRQAEQTAEYIVRVAPHVRRVYTSPLTRCVTTASIIGTAAGLAPVPEAGLTDIDYGEWQGRLVSDVRREAPEAVATWFTRPAQVMIPGGETLAVLAARTLAAMTGIVQDNLSATVVVVAHGTVNRTIAPRALGMPLERFWSIGQGSCPSTWWNLMCS